MSHPKQRTNFLAEDLSASGEYSGSYAISAAACDGFKASASTRFGRKLEL